MYERTSMRDGVEKDNRRTEDKKKRRERRQLLKGTSYAPLLSKWTPCQYQCKIKPGKVLLWMKRIESRKL